MKSQEERAAFTHRNKKEKSQAGCCHFFANRLPWLHGSKGGGRHSPPFPALPHPTHGAEGPAASHGAAAPGWDGCQPEGPRTPPHPTHLRTPTNPTAREALKSPDSTHTHKKKRLQ